MSNFSNGEIRKKNKKHFCSNFSQQAQIAAPQHHSLNACTGSKALVAGPNLHLAHAAAFSEGHRGRGVVLLAGAPILPGAKKELLRFQPKKGGFSSWGRFSETLPSAPATMKNEGFMLLPISNISVVITVAGCLLLMLLAAKLLFVAGQLSIRHESLGGSRELAAI